MTTKGEMEAAHEWADQVSKHLEGWMIGGGEGYWPRLNGPNGARVTICYDASAGGRYRLRGIYPSDGGTPGGPRYYGVTRFDEDPKDTITVSAKRGPPIAARDIARRLLPRYLEIAVYQAMLESVASEHAARMTAMDSATRNAGEMVDRLTLQLNRIRQAAITTEIIEVVSGAAAAQ